MSRACPLCESRDAGFVTDRLRDGEGTVLRCARCGHVFLDLGMEREELERFLDDFYASDAQRRDSVRDLDAYVEAIRGDNLRRLRLCERFLDRTTTVLDVGAGYGLFSYLVRPFVADVTMVDRSALARANAERFGVRWAADLESLDGRFSLVVAFHTVEHFIDPVASLGSLAALLTEHGLLVIEVPNAADLLVRMSRRYRAFYHQTAHLHYFTARTLRGALASAGLRVVESIPTQRYGLANHLKWLTGRPPRTTRGLERAYRRVLARTPWSDTLLYVCAGA